MHKGFTLIEVIVVILIVGILVSLAIPQYKYVIERARSAEGVNILGALRHAQLRYYTERNANFTDDYDDLDVELQTPKFFDTTYLNTDDPIAGAQRRDYQYGFTGGAYNLWINANGAITCSANESVCKKLGYTHVDPPACFLAGTSILMADGSVKAIEEIKVDDMVLSFDEETKTIITDKVKEVMVHTVDSYLIVNKHLKVTSDHPVYNNGKYVPIGQLKIGDSLMKEDGQLEKIFDIQEIRQEVLVYNFEVNPYHNYFAGGYIVHNKSVKPW